MNPRTVAQAADAWAKARDRLLTTQEQHGSEGKALDDLDAEELTLYKTVLEWREFSGA